MSVTNSFKVQEDYQDEPEFISLPISNETVSEIDERYQIIEIISRGDDPDYYSEDELIESTNLINDFEDVNRPSTPINQGIKKRPPPNQKLIYNQAKKIRTNNK